MHTFMALFPVVVASEDGIGEVHRDVCAAWESQGGTMFNMSSLRDSIRWSDAQRQGTNVPVAP